jgi:hypothetical protein
MTSINLILGGTSCTLCRMEVSPSRADGFHAPKTETHSLKIRLPAPQSAPVFSPLGRVIAAVSSLCWRKLARSLSDNPYLARSGPFFSRGPLLISNSVGAFKALRSLPSNALVKLSHQPSGCITKRFKAGV